LEVSTLTGAVTGGSGCPAKEGVKDIAKATEAKPLKALSKGSLGTLMSKAVIGSTLIRIREHLICVIYLLEPLLSPVSVVVVGVIFEG